MREEENILYQVVVNHEKQLCIDRDLSPMWKAIGQQAEMSGPGRKNINCMRPVLDRKKMEEIERKQQQD